MQLNSYITSPASEVQMADIDVWDEIIFPDTPAKLKPRMDIPASPTERFKCNLMSCTMAAYHCPDRQLATVTVGKDFRRVIDTRYLPCSGGTCVQGRKILRQPWAAARAEQKRGGK